MATVDKTFLDLTGLQNYDGKIKEWANSANQVAFKSALLSADGNNLYLYKKANAILGTDTPDATIGLGGGDLATKLAALATVCGATWDSEHSEYDITLDSDFPSATVHTIVDAVNALMGKIKILNGDDTTAGSVAKSIKDAVGGLDVAEFPLYSVNSSILSIAGIKEVDGKIAKGDNSVSLAKIAMTGNSADASYDNTTSGLTSANVQAALDEIAAQSAGGVASKTIWFTDDSAGQSDYAKVYKIYQGENAPDAATNPAVLKGTINVPKDKVLQDASIVDITYNAGHLYDGVTDVTELIVGTGGTATADDAGKYLKMEMQNVDDPLYVNLQTFVDVYTVESGAAEIQLAINNHEISASVVTIDGSKIIYKAETSAGAGDGETVKQALTRLDAAVSVTDSVNYKVKAGIDALDVSEFALGNINGSIICIGGLKEVDGKISKGSGDGITIAPIPDANINALFS